jgi:hypothetical protein
VANVAKIDGLPDWTKVFSTDGVHLLEAAGKVFVEAIISDAKGFSNQEILKRKNKQEGKTNLTKDSKWIAERIIIIEKEIGRLNKDLLE